MKKELLIIAVLLFSFNFRLSAQQDEARLQHEADSLHKVMFTIDTHIDTPVCTNHPEDDYGVEKGQVTFPLMEKGGLDAALFAVYIEQGPRDAQSLQKAVDYVKNEFLLFGKHLDSNSNVAAQAFDSEDFLKYKAQGKRIVMFSIENGYAIGKDLSNLDMFYDMGVRAITLSHNYNNDICDASRDSVAEWNGLSPFGEQVVARMNELGMIIDLSHTSTSTLFDVIEKSKAPVIASHSAVRKLRNHARNLWDDEIRAIAGHGGLVQVAAEKYFLSATAPKKATVKTFVDHVDYVRNLVGIEHVGVGTDFDGGGGLVDLRNAGDMKNITVEMLRRGYTHDEIKMFWGGNFLRLLRQVEKISEELRGE